MNNKFFPVSSGAVTATSSSAATTLPTGPQGQTGPIIRVARETSSVRVFIEFGGSGITATTGSTELISGVVEEFENPNPSYYTHYAVITASGTCSVNIACGPRYSS